MFLRIYLNILFTYLFLVFLCESNMHVVPVKPEEGSSSLNWSYR